MHLFRDQLKNCQMDTAAAQGQIFPKGRKSKENIVCKDCRLYSLVYNYITYSVKSRGGVLRLSTPSPRTPPPPKKSPPNCDKVNILNEFIPRHTHGD